MNSETPTPQNNRWPPQIKYIVGNEACERFSFYGMKGILALYITNVLMQTKDQATNVIHLFGFANYFMPLVGAWVSDRLWGRYKTILWISLFYCVGHGVLATSDYIPTPDGKALALYIGLGLIAFGSGGIKPCASAFMGDQFKPEQRHLLQKAYAAFYWSINLGSFFSFIIIPFIRKQWGYGWAFGVPGIFMAIATFVFWLGTKHYVQVPPTRISGRAGFFKVFFAALNGGKERPSGGSFWDAARAKFSDSEVDAAKSVMPILGIFALVPIFWALFDQTFSTWVLQGEKMVGYQLPLWQFGWIGAGLSTLFAFLLFGLAKAFTNSVRAARKPSFGQGTGFVFFILFTLTAITTAILSATIWQTSKYTYAIGPEEMLSMNPLLVMILIPIMTLGLYPLLGRFATPLRRMSLGMFLAAFSYVIVAWLQTRIDGGAQMSVLWQTAPYIVLTIAEVLVSTTGLEFAFREAAPEMKSTITGFWYFSVALGNLFVSVITLVAGKVLGAGQGHDISVSPKMFLFYAGLTFVVAIIFSVAATFYRYRDAAAAQGR